MEWALRLADDVLVLAPDNASAFETKKAAMLALAENTMNSQARNMLLSDYLLMTDQIHVPVALGDPKVDLLPNRGPELCSVDAHGHPASHHGCQSQCVQIRERRHRRRPSLTDIKKNDPKQPNRYRLNVRKGILEVIPPSASGGEFVIVTDSLTWKQLVLYKLNPEEAVANGKVIITGGTPPSFYAFMGLFK
jgi:hypothetical protein